MSRTSASARTAASARTSATSRSSGNTRPIGVHIESWIPLNINTFSSVSGSTFKPSASKTYIDPSDYDGSPVYSFVVVAQNTGASDYTVSLLDSANNVKATHTILTGQTTLARYSTPVTLNAGADTYSIQLSSTTNTDELVCKPSRIEVRQTFATKTALRIPMCSRNVSLSTDITAIIDSTTSTSFVQTTSDRYAIWKRVAANYSTVFATNGYTFTAVLSNNNAGATTTASLFNRTSGNEVVNSRVTNTGTTATLVQSTFTSDTEFTDNTEFEVKFKTSANTGRLHKATLTIKLQAVANSVFKGESLAGDCMAGDSTFSASNTHTQGTVKIDSSAMSNPTFYQQVTARESVAGSGGSSIVGIQDGGGTDQTGAIGVGTQVTGATATVTGVSTKTLYRSGAFTVVDGDRYFGLTKTVATGATVVYTQGVMVCAFTSAV